MLDLVFITDDDPDTPSRRFRMEAFLPLLENAGMSCKVIGLPDALLQRIICLLGVPEAKTIVIQKKLLRSFEMRLLKKKSSKLIYDFDDAVYLSRKGSRRFVRILQEVDQVFAGNDVLASKALQINKNTLCVPTGIDLERFRPAKGENHSPLRIGWIGSKGNLKNLHLLTIPLLNLKMDLAFSLRYICDSRDRSLEQEGWEYVPWSRNSEVEALSCLDIGVMPLADNEYNKGKCGFKIVQYMAMGIPPVASPVGVNEAFIKNGVNGLLARTDEDWEKALSLLLSDSAERVRMGEYARMHARDFSCSLIFENIRHHLLH